TFSPSTHSYATRVQRRVAYSMRPDVRSGGVTGLVADRCARLPPPGQLSRWSPARPPGLYAVLNVLLLQPRDGCCRWTTLPIRSAGCARCARTGFVPFPRLARRNHGHDRPRLTPPSALRPTPRWRVPGHPGRARASPDPRSPCTGSSGDMLAPPDIAALVTRTRPYRHRSSGRLRAASGRSWRSPARWAV